MKVLWVCNIMLPLVAEYLHKEVSNKEGWLTGLADTILKNGRDNNIELAVAFPVEEALKESKMVIPVEAGKQSLFAYGFAEDMAHPENYSADLEVRFKAITEDFKPDIVHCFGTEFPHTLAVTRVFDKSKVLIGVQGICELITDVYLADLPDRVINRLTFRDFVRKDSILNQRDKFFLRGRHEREALGNAEHVIGRTGMDKAHTAECNADRKYYFMNETLRSAFYEDKWTAEKCEKYSMFLSQGDYPLKGLHYVLRAMPFILEKYPDAKLYVAGNPIVREKNWAGYLKVSSYGKYIRELLEQNHLENKVVFLGKMSAGKMKEQFLKSNLFICASAIENSPNSLGEAMLLGVPCVAAEVGGVSSVFVNGQDGITYPGYGAPEYEKEKDKERAQALRLAQAVIEMWSDEKRMKEYCKGASVHARETHDPQKNYLRLLEIYGEVAGI